MSKIKVAVLMGGRSAERAVSLSTGMMILQALDKGKYAPFAVDAAMFASGSPPQLERAGREIDALVQAEKALSDIGGAKGMNSLLNGSTRPDVAFIALHGRYGEDGTIQGMLELAGIPYTGSGVLASALAMDKIMSKKVLRLEGVPVLPSVDIISARELMNRNVPAEVAELGYPVIVKPSRQGSTIGMTKVDSPESLQEALDTALRHDSQLMIEKFIVGTEITAGVIGNDDLQVLPLVEIVPSGGFYDYEAKYTPGATEEIVPARIPESQAEEARRITLLSHKALGCRGMSRVDIIITDDRLPPLPGRERAGVDRLLPLPGRERAEVDQLPPLPGRERAGVRVEATDDIPSQYVLEVNTIPGMTRTSLLPLAAQAAGIAFPDLLDKLIALALEAEP